MSQSRHIYLCYKSEAFFKWKTFVSAKSGTGVYITDHSTVIFGRNSNVEFIENSADHNGGAAFVSNYSTALCDQNSKIRFNYNLTIIFAEINSNIIFSDNSTIIFHTNRATFNATVYSNINTKMTTKENSIIIF